MNHSAADLIERLASELLSLPIDFAALSVSAGIPGPTTARILRLECDPSIDQTMTLARCIGRVLVLAPESFKPSNNRPVFRARGAGSFAVQDLLRLRDGFRAYRRAMGVSPTRLAQLCDVHEKAFLRTENASRVPTLGLVCDCAEPLGLAVTLVPEADLPSLTDALETDRKRRAAGIASELERALPQDSDLPPAVRPLAAMLTDIAHAHDLGVRQIAAATGIEPRILTGERRRSGQGSYRLNAIASLPTTLRVASVLGCELLIASSDAAEEIGQLTSGCAPAPSPLDARLLDRAVEDQLDTMRKAVERASIDLVRTGASPSDVTDVERLGSSLRHAHTARLAQRLEELGFVLMAVPSDVASRARRIAERARLSPRKDVRKENRETTIERNRRLTERFIGKLESACRTQRRRPIDLPQTRTPLQAVLERLEEADLALDLIDVSTRQTLLRYRGRDAGELVGHIIDLRVKRGFSLHSLGAGVQLTHSAIRRAEKPEARRKALLSSVLRYAETIGVDLVPSHS